MAIKITLTGDTADLKSKLKDLGVEFEELDDSTVALGKSADTTGKKLEDAYGSDLDSRLGAIEDATKRAADATEELAGNGEGLLAVGEAFGNASQLGQGMADTLTVLEEQFGVSLGPMQEYTQAATDLLGGFEGIIVGGVGLAEQLGPLAAKMGPVIASTWAHVTALYAQATAFIAANAPILIIIGSLALLAAGVILAIKYWDEIAEKFPVLGVIADEVKGALEDFRAWLTGPFVDGIQALWDKFDVVFKAIGILIDAYLKQWQIIFQTGVDVVLGIFDIFAGIFTGDMGRVKDGILAIFGALWTGAEELFQLGIDTLIALAPLLLEGGKKLGGALLDGLTELIEKVIEMMKALPGEMMTALGNLGDLLYEAGKDIIRGLIRGIGDMKDAALGAIGDVAGGVKDKALGAFKINSPSLVFAEIGAGLMEGMEKGIFDEQKRPLSAIDKMAIGIRQAMDKLTTNEAGGGGPAAALERITTALLEMGYTMEDIEPNAKKIMETLGNATNEAGDGAITYAEAIEQILASFNKLFADPDVKAVVTATVKTPSGKENSSANASGGSLLGIGLGEQAPKSNQGSAAQTKAAKEEAEREKQTRLLQDILTALRESNTLMRQGLTTQFGTGL